MNDAPKTPVSTTTTEPPIGQAQVGFKGIAEHDGEMNTRQGVPPSHPKDCPCCGYGM